MYRLNQNTYLTVISDGPIPSNQPFKRGDGFRYMQGDDEVVLLKNEDSKTVFVSRERFRQFFDSEIKANIARGGWSYETA